MKFPHGVSPVNGLRRSAFKPIPSPSPTAANAALSRCLVYPSFHLGTRILQAMRARFALRAVERFGLLCQIWPQRV